MIVAKETTNWSGSAKNTPNHTYVLSDKKQKVYAYWNVLDESFHVLSTKGSNFSASYRRFDIVARDIRSIDEVDTKNFFKK